MGEARRKRLRALLKTVGLELEIALIEPAFVHESAAREGAGTSNERLEFYGDAILGFVTARWLMKRYPKASEGELARRRSALVSGDSCALTAERLQFGDLLLLGNGMQQAGGARNMTILADAFEAFIAVIAEHAGLDAAASFIESQHLDHVETGDMALADAKTALQELTQGRFSTTPVYFERAEGPPHDRRFTSQVRVGEEILGEGIGPSKKIAQQSAASMALAQLRARHPEAPEPPPSNSDGRVVQIRSRRQPDTPKAPV